MAPLEQPPFAGEVVRIRRNPWILGLAASPLLLTPIAIFAGIFVKAGFFGLVFHPLLFALIALAFAWQRNWRPVVEPTAVRASEAGVDVGDLHVPRAEIRSGFVRPGNPPRVILRRRWALPIELQVGSTEEGRGLLRALGLDVSQTVAEFRAKSRALAKRRYMVSAVGIFLGVYGGFISALVTAKHGHHPGLAAVGGVAFVLAFIGLMTTLLMPTKLSVGADGIVLRWFGSKQFIGYGDVLDVSRFDKGWGRSRQIGVNLTLQSGEQIGIPIGQPSWGEENVAIIEERIREAMEAFRAGGAAADAALLRRGERGVSDWVQALRAIGSGANADMRTAPLPRERLFRIVESPAAGAAERAAAAVALGSDLDDEGKARLKSAAEAIAAPKLRVVIDTAASKADDAELEAALAELDQEEAKRSA